MNNPVAFDTVGGFAGAEEEYQNYDRFFIPDEGVGTAEASLCQLCREEFVGYGLDVSEEHCKINTRHSMG